MSVNVLISHLGYDTHAPAAVIVRLDKPGHRPQVTLLSDEGTRTLMSAPDAQRVDSWSTGAYARVELPASLPAGTYRVEATAAGESATSAEFTVGEDRLIGNTVSDVLAYFRSMRSSGEIDRKDAAARLYGDDQERTVDARGGWLDASGDPSKFLSHLSYTQMMSPQQIPLVAWALLAARDELQAHNPRFDRILGAKLRDEALHGADFLTRFRAPQGYFYVGIFDALTKDLAERVVNAPLPECVRTDRYQASFRAGGGLAIAALARASREAVHGDATSEEYLAAAITAFDDLLAHNREYLFGLDLDTGALTESSESIVDDYCALLAATELYGATGEERFADVARARATQLQERYQDEGWFIGAEDGRPYFHSAEAGLPVLALLRFAELVPDSGDARAAAVRVMADAATRTDAVANPFGYPRQHARWTTGEERDTFFFPHHNDTGYWWQGENAGIASLSAAASAVAALPECPPDVARRLRQLAYDQLHWVLGNNPFDACMLQGRGRNNAEYSIEYPNLPGGIANGITSGLDDEHDIAFLPSTENARTHTWRWAEQWIPHSAWFTLAMCSASRTTPPPTSDAGEIQEQEQQ